MEAVSCVCCQSEDLGRQDLLDALRRLVAGPRIGRAGGVLHADGVDVDAAVEELLHDVDVELGRVDRVVLERQAHQRDADLVVHARRRRSACRS